MGSKIYVGGLPYSTTEQQLSDLFAAHGAVASARIITDKFTGQSRGFGFVEMASEDEAKTAINALIAGEIDYMEAPQHDLLPVVKKDPNLKLVDINPHHTNNLDLNKTQKNNRRSSRRG